MERKSLSISILTFIKVVMMCKIKTLLCRFLMLNKVLLLKTKISWFISQKNN